MNSSIARTGHHTTSRDRTLAAIAKAIAHPPTHPPNQPMITLELTEAELADLLAAFDSYTQYLTATRERWVQLGGLRDKLAAVTRPQQ